jgi:hypothetical protein
VVDGVCYSIKKAVGADGPDPVDVLDPKFALPEKLMVSATREVLQPPAELPPE